MKNGLQQTYHVQGIPKQYLCTAHLQHLAPPLRALDAGVQGPEAEAANLLIRILDQNLRDLRIDSSKTILRSGTDEIPNSMQSITLLVSMHG